MTNRLSSNIVPIHLARLCGLVYCNIYLRTDYMVFENFNYFICSSNRNIYCA